MGLKKESFANVHSQILAHDPLPPLDTIFNIIQQEENHKRIMMEGDHRVENTVAFTASHGRETGMQTLRKIWSRGDQLL